ncbi:MAG: DUF3304 domain-containing protein [Azoarcus sp.]|nr:DUF3304 domain-containing protein [Azoarcus sp.]
MQALGKKLIAFLVCATALLAGGNAACQQKEAHKKEEMVPVMVVVYDQNDSDVVVLSYSVERQVGGTPGGKQCCVKLPERWRPGLSFELYWDYTEESEGSPPPQKRQVEIREYKPDRMGILQIHLLPGHRVIAVSSARGFGSPFYPLPKEDWVNGKVNSNLLRNWRHAYYEMIKGGFIPDDEDWKWAAQWGLYKEEAMRQDHTPAQEQSP